MKLSATLLALVCLAISVFGDIVEEDQDPPTAGPEEPPIPVGEDGKYTLEAQGIRAQFIPYGASITNLFINDTHGIERDVVLGFDNATYYAQDKKHDHMGGIPGRYANRIKNSTFYLQGQTFKTDPNEHGGLNTLHGGSNGWDYRKFEVVKYTRNTLIFKIIDPDGEQGFPGQVTSYIEYYLTSYRWHIYINGTSTKPTPLMLTSHVYWNLDGFQNPNTNTALNHTLFLPFSGLRVEVDGILIPTGNILPNKVNSVNDFRSKPKVLGASFADPEINGNCGTGCVGYDNCYLVQRDQYGADYYAPLSDGAWYEADPIASLLSSYSGIQLNIYSDQNAFQLYSCNGQDGTMPLKKTQGFFNDTSRPRVVPQYGCVVMEVQDWIAGINYPEWQRGPRQIIDPNPPPYKLEAIYSFTMTPKKAQKSVTGPKNRQAIL